MSTRRTVIVVAVALSLALAGCSGMGDDVGSGGDGADGGDAGDYQVAESTPAPESGATGLARQGAVGGQADGADGDAGDAPVEDRGRAIVREGTMAVEVDNYSTARASVARRAESLGGYVSDSNQRLHRDGDSTHRTGHVVVRVPADRYDEMQDAVSEEGTVVHEQTETTDVTDQLVDLEARLENLEQRRDRLRTFYREANDTEELLRIEAELSEVQGEIERLEAEQRSLERRVAYSTLRVELREPAPGGSVETQYHEQSLLATFLESVGDVYRFARATLVTGAALVPWLVVLAVPAVALRAVYRRGRLPVVGRGNDSGPAADATADERVRDETDDSGDGRDDAGE